MNWLDWHAGQQSFTDIALVRRESVNFSVGAGQGSPERLRGVRASSGFLSVLGLKPKIGRDLSAVDDIAGAPNVALISENLWRHDFGASPSVLGRRVLIDGLQREIIGVFPAELQFGRNPDVLLPLSEIAKEPWMLKRDYHQGWSGTWPTETWCDDLAGDERSQCDRHRSGQKISAKQRGSASEDAAAV